MRLILFLIAPFLFTPANAENFCVNCFSLANGNLVQTSLSGPGEGQYPFVNDFWDQPGGDWVVNSPRALINASTLNIYGFPTTASNLAATTGWASQEFPIPTQTERAGTYQSDWIGYAEFEYPEASSVSAVTPASWSSLTSYSINNIVAGSDGYVYTSLVNSNLNNNPASNANPADWSKGATVPSGCSVSSKNVTGTNCIASVTPNLSDSQQYVLVLAVGDGTSAPQLTQFRFYHVNDTAAMSICQIGVNTGNSYDLQSCFGAKFLSQLTTNFGASRDLNVSNANSSIVTTWEERTPLIWANFGGNWYNQSWLTTNQPQLSAGISYTLSAPNFCPGGVLAGCDKQKIFVLPASAIAVATATVNGAVTSPCASPCTVNLDSVPSSLVTGMVVGDADSDMATAGVTISAIGASSVTIACVQACLIHTIPNGDTLYFSPMLNVNGLGFLPLVSNTGTSLGTFNILPTTAELHANWSTLVYDAAYNAFMVSSASATNSGLNGGWPPELTVALANAAKVHPWFVSPCYAMDPPTDWTTQLASYSKTHLAYGIIPRDETPNEDWNTIHFCTLYAYNRQYLKSGVNFDANNWSGYAASIIGQGWASVYGFTQSTPASTRNNYYQVISGMQTTPSAIPTKGGGQQDNRVASAWYVANGGTPAYDWIAGIATTSYYESTCTNTITEIALAFSYYTYVQTSGASGLPIGTAAGYYLNNTGSLGFGPACGVNLTTSTLNNLYLLQNVSFPNWSNYVASYINASIPIFLTQYEGGYAQNGGGGEYNVGTQSAAITAVSTGTMTTTLTVTGADGGDNAWDFMCNTSSLCTGSSGSPQIELTGTYPGCTGLATATPYYVSSANSTTVTINQASSGSCTPASATAVYYGAGTGTGWMEAFELAVMHDTTSSNIEACELANMQSFLAAGKAASPSITNQFPSEFSFADNSPWGKFNTDIYQTATPLIAAVQAYQAAQAGSTSCSP
jgi:hypothetical protein